MTAVFFRYPPNSLLRNAICVGVVVLVGGFSGCGATREQQATEQLVLSSAVDRSVSTIDFRPLSARKVYLDTSYLRSVKGSGFVNADYVISSLRQQIVAAGCLLQDSSKEAEIIIEARLGTLGSDDHRVTYGIPESNMLQSAASLIPSAPVVPSIPEIAFARREAREAAAKIAVFAYDRESRQAVWQSGLSESTATARDTYVLGVGPFQGGSIRERTRLVGSELLDFGTDGENLPRAPIFERPPVDYTASTTFQSGWPSMDTRGFTGEMMASSAPDPVAEIAQVSAESAVTDSKDSPAKVVQADGQQSATENKQPSPKKPAIKPPASSTTAPKPTAAE